MEGAFQLLSLKNANFKNERLVLWLTAHYLMIFHIHHAEMINKETEDYKFIKTEDNYSIQQ